MLFSWLTERRRKRLEAEPFPESWQKILAANVAHFAYLDNDERDQLRKLVQVFVAEKHWEGAGGLELDDEIRVTIAGDACLLLLGRDHSLYEDVSSIVVYPSTVKAPERTRSFFDTTVSVVDQRPTLLGEAHRSGPVILAWDAVQHGARNPQDGHNLVLHEFAHKIDLLDRHADGTPPLDNRTARKNWAEVASKAFLDLRAKLKKGKDTFLDPYAATNEAEFFAVVTEFFFERSAKLQETYPSLYDLLRAYYQQDPAERRRLAKKRKAQADRSETDP